MQKRRQAVVGVSEVTGTPDDDVQRQAEIQGRMTPEQKAVNDGWQERVRQLSGVSGPQEEDTVISESPVQSEYPDETFLYSNDGQNDHADNEAKQSNSKGKKKVAFAMSGPVPMGPYRPNKQPMTGTVNPQPNRKQAGRDDDDGSCWPWECWNRLCWGWGFTWLMGGRPKVDLSNHGRAEATS